MTDSRDFTKRSNAARKVRIAATREMQDALKQLVIARSERALRRRELVGRSPSVG
jgi:hypothetical protein